MSKIYLGRYIMQDCVFGIYYDPGTWDGSVDFKWEKNSFVSMTIGGIASKNWSQVLGTALHELVELSFRLSKTSYQPAYNMLTRDDTGKFRFMMTHDQFTESMDHVADVLVYLIPKLRAAFVKSRKKKK